MRRLQQRFALGEMGLRGLFAEQQFNRPKCRYGSNATFWALWPDVRFAPESDRESRHRRRPRRGTGTGAAPFFGGKAGQIAGMPCSCDCDWLGHLHDRRMGNARIRLSVPDLFSTAARELTSSELVSATLPAGPPEQTTPALVRYALPADLSGSLGQLDNQQFERLLLAVLDEQKRRGGSKHRNTDRSESRPKTEVTNLTLPKGKLRAIHAAYRAGVRPAQIARHFGVSQGDVRKVLRVDTLKR